MIIVYLFRIGKDVISIKLTILCGKIAVWGQQAANSNNLMTAGKKADMPDLFFQVEMMVQNLVTIMGLKGLREETGSRIKWPLL